MMDGQAWNRLLSDATARVQAKVSKIAARGESAQSVGVGASGDITLLADKEAEEQLFAALRKVKGLRIVSEEAGALGDPRAKLAAVVDPLDGSSNFSRGIPFYCTSVAVATGGSLGDVTFGLIRDLVTGDVYWAEKGNGAYKNGRRIASSSRPSLGEAVLGLDVSRSTPGEVAGLSRLMAGARRQVHFGANALELCFLAEGKIDAFVDVRGKMRMTDFAAGFLVAREAGARMTLKNALIGDLPLDLKTRISFVAAGNPRLHSSVLRLVP